MADETTTAAAVEETGADLGAEAGAEERAPVGEVIRHRRRAQEAERRAGDLQRRVDELERTLASARESMDAVERRHAIDLALMEEGSVDLEASRLLTEMAVSAMDEPDVSAAVAELRRRKPFLFRGTGRSALPVSGGAAMSGRGVQAGGAGDGGLADAAEAASASGDRAALLRYLRARRGR